MKKKVLILLAVLLVALIAAIPAFADPPVKFTGSDTFPDINPCTELPDEITINFEFSEHQAHASNFIAHVKRTGTTDAGYVMDHGVENFQVNANVARGAFTDIWHHANGLKFKVQGVFAFNIGMGELLVDNFSLECIGN